LEAKWQFAWVNSLISMNQLHPRVTNLRLGLEVLG